MMIQYRELTVDALEEAKTLYEQHGWLAYLNDDAKLERAFTNSLYLFGAYENDRLVGFIRCVGDGEHIVMVQDLIIAATHQRKGIGRELMRRISERFDDVRMFMLLTDVLDKDANAFYQSIGMHKIEENGCVGYMR